MINGLDLFSGIGGMSIALQPWARTVCYVENEKSCTDRIRERITAGELDDGDIWDDITAFDPRPWYGLIDIITAGFPCQDLSYAGNGAGLAGERSGLFFEITRIARVIRPRYIFLENVPAITVRGGRDVAGELTALGYDSRWGVLSAYDVGAPHLRERWWCLSSLADGSDMGFSAQKRHADDGAQPGNDGTAQFMAHTGSGSGGAGPERAGRSPRTDIGGGGQGAELADAPGERRGKAGGFRCGESSEWLAGSGKDVSDAERLGHQGPEPARAPASERRRSSDEGEALPDSDRTGRSGILRKTGQGQDGPELRSDVDGEGARGRGNGATCPAADTRGEGLEIRDWSPGQWTHAAIAGSDWWATEPRICRVVDGVPDRVDRIKALGNAVVPACAREAFIRLMGL